MSIGLFHLKLNYKFKVKTLRLTCHLQKFEVKTLWLKPLLTLFSAKHSRYNFFCLLFITAVAQIGYQSVQCFPVWRKLMWLSKRMICMMVSSLVQICFLAQNLVFYLMFSISLLSEIMSKCICYIRIMNADTRVLLVMASDSLRPKIEYWVLVPRKPKNCNKAFWQE